MSQRTDDYSLQREFKQIWDKKWWVIITTVAAFGLGVLISSPLVTRPEFRSDASLLPPNYSSVKSLSFRPLSYRGPGAASKEDLERLVSAMSSDTVIYFMTKKFNLLEYYELADIEDKVVRTKALKKVFAERVSISVSAYSTVEVVVFDYDPVMAYRLAQAYVAYADSTIKSVGKRYEGYKNLKSQLDSIEAEIQLLKDTLSTIRQQHGVFILNQLPEAFANQMSNKFSDPKFAQLYDFVRASEIKLGNLEHVYSEMLEEVRFREANLKTYPSYLTVLAPPTINYNKVRPNRPLVTILFTVGGLLFSVFFVVVYNRFKGMYKQEAERSLEQAPKA